MFSVLTKRKAGSVDENGTCYSLTSQLANQNTRKALFTRVDCTKLSLNRAVQYVGKYLLFLIFVQSINVFRTSLDKLNSKSLLLDKNPPVPLMD